MRAGRFSALGVLLVTVLACGGGDGGGSPSAPPPPATVTGQWNGTGTITGVNPSGHCVAQTLSGAVGVPVDVRATMNQSGSNVTGTYVVDANTCDFSGTLTGQRLSANVTACQTVSLTVPCASGRNYQVTTLSSTIEGTFDGARQRFDGTQRTEARATRGNETFDFALLISLELAKQ